MGENKHGLLIQTLLLLAASFSIFLSFFSLLVLGISIFVFASRRTSDGGGCSWSTHFS